MKIKKITDYLEQLAPLCYQESYDNSGLLIGDKETNIKRVLITLDCTEEVLKEAIDHDYNLIITHHPVIFSGIKKINGNSYTERIIIKAIKNDIAIYAIHTNLDNVKTGVNSIIAKKLQLENCNILLKKSDLLRQLVVYCPKESSSKLTKALFSAGAGSIGNYQNCSFSSSGEGTFKPIQGATPYLGNIGQIHREKEDKVEVIYPKYKEEMILYSMRKNHPYEEIAHQIYSINNHNQSVGSGMIGELSVAIESKKFLQMLKETMQTESIRYTPLVNKKIKRVAVCGGSGSFLIDKAKSMGADIFITSDVKYHQFFNSENKIIIADIGHYESEQFTKHLLYDMLTKKFTKFAIQLSKVNTNPINYL